MKLPEVSVNGAIGRRTSLNSMLALNGLKVTTISAPESASVARAPAEESHRLVVQKEDCLETTRQHLGRVQTTLDGVGTHKLRTDGVSGFSQ